MMKTIRQVAFAVSLILSLTLCATAQTAGPRPLTPAAMPVGERVRKELAEFKGKVTLFAKNLDSGATFGVGEDLTLKPYGLGVTTPREMVTLLERVERGEIISREASKEMLALMKREQIHDGIGRTLNGVEMATKSGALDQLRSNVGIIYTKRGRIAMAITCDEMPEVDWTEDNAGLLMLSRLSLILIDGLGQPPADEHR